MNSWSDAGHANRISGDALTALERLSAAADPGPWKAMIEGRDHSSGDSFIQVGEGAGRSADMYVSRDGIPASPEDIDFIAAARNALPDLIAEIRRLRVEEHR